MFPEKVVELEERETTSIEDARHFMERLFKTRYEHTTVNDVTLHSDGTAEFISYDGTRRRLPFAQHFLESLARHIKIPISYAYDCSFALFNHNFEKRKGDYSRGLTLCINRDSIIDAAGPEYDFRCVCNRQLLDVLAFDEELWQLEKIVLNDEGMSLRLLSRNDVVEPRPGDVIRVGIVVTNSETGGRHAKAALYTHRLICTNGAIASDHHGVVWWSVDKRMHQTTKLAAFQSKVANFIERAVSIAPGLYNGVADRQLFERDFVQLHRRLHYAIHDTDRVDDILGIDRRDRSAVQSRVRDLDPGDRGSPTRWLIYDVHNRITAAAREIVGSTRASRFVLQHRLEEIGGELLDVTQPSMN